MMKKYFLLNLLFLIIVNGCARQNQINFSSSEAFFSSLDETKIIQKRNNKNNSVLNSLTKNEINNSMNSHHNNNNSINQNHDYVPIQLFVYLKKSN